MKSININGNTYTADRLWYAVQRDPEDEWGNGSEWYATAVEMLRDQGCGLICVIDDGKDPVAIAEFLYDDLFGSAELTEQTLYDIAGAWSIYETDTGDVYRETTREVLDDLCARGYGDLCRVSGSGKGALISYVQGAPYDGRRFWRKILGRWDRQKTDWRLDYARITRIRDEEAKEREQK